MIGCSVLRELDDGMKNLSLREKIALRILRLLCSKKHYVEVDKEVCFQRGFASSEEFFRRFDNRVDFKSKTVVDIGCGYGATCYYMALHGAKRVVGLDANMERVAFARSKLKDYPNLDGLLTFKSPVEMNQEKFDLVISKDSFEHFDNPEKMMLTLKGYLKPSGKLFIGFSPLWKSPYGGHLSTFTRMPWIHLLFPERVLMQELRRFLNDESVSSFKQIAGGLNKMVFKRYLRIAQDLDLSFEFLKTNVSSNSKERSVLFIFTILGRIPGGKDYFTVNLYSILRARTSSH
jgi:SAM-dependent methyltransferase